MSKRLLFGLIVLVVLFFAAGFIVFNKSGLLSYLKLKGEITKLNEDIGKKDLEISALRAEIDSLKRNVPAKIEKIAREEYGLKRPGEKIIKVEEK